MVDGVLFVAEIGFVIFVEFRIDVISQLLCERYRNVWLGDFLLVFCAILSDPDLVFLRKDEKNSKAGWCIQVCFGRPVALLVVLTVEGIATS